MAITKKDVNNKDRKQLTRPPKEYTQEEQRLIDGYLTRSKMKLLKHKGGQAIVGSLTQREGGHKNKK